MNLLKEFNLENYKFNEKNEEDKVDEFSDTY